jgi:hypothetical protein
LVGERLQPVVVDLRRVADQQRGVENDLDMLEAKGALVLKV